MNSRFSKSVSWVLALAAAVGVPLVLAQDAPIKTERHTVKVETIASGLTSPWAVAFLPDGLTLITEKAGNLRVMRDGKLWPKPVSGLPAILMHGQGGLLDVVAHPEYS